MCHIKHPLLTLLLTFVLLSPLAGQNLWRNTSVVGGLALGGQDRRLFYFPPADRLLARNPKKLDYDLTLYLEKRVFKWRPIQIKAGIGYAESNTIFGRPFDHAFLDGIFTEELRYVTRYTVNKLILPISAGLHFSKFHVQISTLPAIGFRKSVLDRGGAGSTRFTKWQFAWNGLEINPGLGFQFSDRLQVSLSYRWFYFHEIDEVIFNSNIFYEHHDDELLQNKTDKYNPFKMWLTVGYKWKQ